MAHDTQPPAEKLADHFAVGCWHQPDDTYAGECACGATFRGDTYRAAKVAWAEHAAVTRRAGGDAIPAKYGEKQWTDGVTTTKGASHPSSQVSSPASLPAGCSAPSAETPKPPAGGDAGAAVSFAETVKAELTERAPTYSIHSVERPHFDRAIIAISELVRALTLSAAPLPTPQTFDSETNKDRTASEDL